MGLTTFWTQLTAPRVREIAPQQRLSNPEQRGPGTTSSVQKARKYNTEPNVISDVILTQPAISAEEGKMRRRSRGGVLTQQRSEGNLRKRRSWFGGRPAVDENVPDVPTLPLFCSGRNRHMADQSVTGIGRPGTALTTDEQVPWSRSVTPEGYEGKEKRKSIFGSRKRSQSSVSQVKSKKRQSWFGGRASDDDAPPMPAAPTTRRMEQTGQQSYAVQAPENEGTSGRRLSRSRAPSRPRSKSNVSSKSKRKSWFQSRNPDDADIEEEQPPVPQMPALMYDYGHATPTPDSSVATTRSPDQSNFIDHNIFADSPVRAFMTEDPVKTMRRGNSIKQPRPISGVSLSSRRRSYIPKNAANGFLRSASGNRASQRHSLLDDGDGGMICLSEEQQVEWDKLKHLMEVMESRQDDGVIGMLRELEEDEHAERRHDRSMYRNDDALAALEFGVAH
ncbi:hypothetical protein LTR36_002593 [Oleoguttula mirabilis]|uniref:Uncharacterized protein n=1 Tax=Oleoguttula mirabilis TaxID=1507867 RepID=A0AAV9JJN7_9PEZI|nr:hypothetical protein LTR36_002593 [Oleoguttula mirabilis]